MSAIPPPPPGAGAPPPVALVPQLPAPVENSIINRDLYTSSATKTDIAMLAQAEQRVKLDASNNYGEKRNGNFTVAISAILPDTWIPGSNKSVSDMVPTVMRYYNAVSGQILNKKLVPSKYGYSVDMDLIGKSNTAASNRPISDVDSMERVLAQKTYDTICKTMYGTTQQRASITPLQGLPQKLITGTAVSGHMLQIVFDYTINAAGEINTVFGFLRYGSSSADLKYFTIKKNQITDIQLDGMSLIAILRALGLNNLVSEVSKPPIVPTTLGGKSIRRRRSISRKNRVVQKSVPTKKMNMNKKNQRRGKMRRSIRPKKVA